MTLVAEKRTISWSARAGQWSAQSADVFRSCLIYIERLLTFTWTTHLWVGGSVLWRNNIQPHTFQHFLLLLTYFCLFSYVLPKSLLNFIRSPPPRTLDSGIADVSFIIYKVYSKLKLELWLYAFHREMGTLISMKHFQYSIFAWDGYNRLLGTDILCLLKRKWLPHNKLHKSAVYSYVFM